MNPIWKPSGHRVADANLTRYMAWLRENRGINCRDFAELYRWSVDDAENFWPSVWDFAGLRWQVPPSTTVVDFDKMPGARWFPGGRINFSESLLRFCPSVAEESGDAADGETASDPAIIFWSEHGIRRRIGRSELRRQVERLAARLHHDGVRPGDRIAGYLPNVPETVVAMLAATRIGAIWSSCSPDFGVQGVLDRFGQIEPKVLFAADGYWYGGKRFDSIEKTREICRRLPGLGQTVVVPYVSESPDLTDLPNPRMFGECIDHVRDSVEPYFGEFDHPAYILYTSGTTGAPKCIVHGAGGTLLQHAKELMLHTDVKRGDRLFYYTTCGWMMWNWLVSGLAVGAAIVLFEGSPFHPHPGVLFEMAEKESVTAFGASAKFIAAAEKAAVRPAVDRDLGPLRTVLSTGSPLAPSSFDYVYSSVKSDVCLSSISGGTDIVSCFVLGNPIGPVYRGEIQTRGLGMRVEVFDEEGNPIRGRQGELVCTQPFPSMPIGFWNDPNGEKYRDAYFAMYPGVWRHGDWAELTPRDGVIIYGRSDATLNPGGVRIGTAEIYRQVETHDEVLESLVVGQEWENDVRIVLFVRLRPGIVWNDELAQKVRNQIRANATPRHVPARIIPIADIPRTISGKISELAVRNVIHNRPVKNTEALANPEALELFRNLPELQV